MPHKDPAKRKEYNKLYLRKYSKTDRGKEVNRRAQQKYMDSPKGLAKREKQHGSEHLEKKKWYSSTPRGKELAFKHHMKSRYSMSVDDYNDLFEKQGGVCAICGEGRLDRRLYVDHDHKCCIGDKSCGKCVRGLLCEKCNWLLGYGRDSILILEKAICYIKDWDESK